MNSAEWRSQQHGYPDALTTISAEQEAKVFHWSQKGKRLRCIHVSQASLHWFRLPNLDPNQIKLNMPAD